MIKVASALIVYKHKLLLHLRDNKHPDPNLRNKWGLVGGTIEKDENPLTAVLREVKEEANLTPQKVNYTSKFGIDKPNDKVEVKLFCAELSDSEASLLKLGNEGLAVKFFSTSEIPDLPLSPEVKKYYSENQRDIEAFIDNGISLNK